jgi:putative glutamine amidotransferase
MKPIIGVTSYYQNGKRKPVTAISHNYIRSVHLAGGLPVIIPILNNEEDISSYVDMVDGILFTGGADISPMYYGENPIKEISTVFSNRDDQELALFKGVYEKNKPILGICRGNQLINVALGGTLYQDIFHQVDGALGHDPAESPVDELFHSVNIMEGSKLYDIFETEKLNVNSFHHQAIKDVAKNLKIVAKSSEGIIEAVECEDRKFLLGVQWHPEDLTVRYPIFLELFKSFVDACRK